MLEKLKEAEAKYVKITEDLSKPEIVSDQENFKRLMREHKLLTPVIEKYREYNNVLKSISEAEELLSEPELKEMAEG